MSDFTKVRIRNEFEPHQEGIELTSTECAHYVYINFANEKVSVRIPRIADDGRTTEITLERFFEHRIEEQRLSPEIHVETLEKSF
jgi:hypothetical protein